MSERVAVYVPALMYRALYPHAQRRRMDVGELMAELAVAQLFARTQQPAAPAQEQQRAVGKRVAMTADRLAQLRVLLTASTPYREISAQLGMGVSTVAVYAKRIREGEL